MVYFFSHFFLTHFFLGLTMLHPWKKKPLSQGGTSRRRERKKKEYQRRERLRRKKSKVREKVGKSRNTVFFQGLVAPEGRQVDSLKWRVRSHLVVWEIKTCTPLWREAHFEVTMCKAHRVRSTFGSLDVEKANAVVARSTFWCVSNTTCLDHFWRWLLKKCTPLWREAAFELNMLKAFKSTTCSDHFWRLRCRKGARCCGAKHMSKWKALRKLTISYHLWMLRCRLYTAPHYNYNSASYNHSYNYSYSYSHSYSWN